MRMDYIVMQIDFWYWSQTATTITTNSVMNDLTGEVLDGIQEKQKK